MAKFYNKKIYVFITKDTKAYLQTRISSCEQTIMQHIFPYALKNYSYSQIHQ